MPNPMSTYRIEVVADSGEGRNRIMAYDERGFAFGDTGERDNTVEDYQTTLKALYFAIERIAELEQAIAALQAQGAEPLAYVSDTGIKRLQRRGREQFSVCNVRTSKNVHPLYLGAAPPAQAARVPSDHAMVLADKLYSVGYCDAQKEQDYDPRGSVQWQEVVDAIAAPAPAEKAIPDNWKLVPVEPTRAMRYAIEDTELPEFCTSSRQSRHHNLGVQVYRAMLDAAPQEQEGKANGNG